MVSSSTNNPGAGKIVLGIWDKLGQNGYIEKAKALGATYFDTGQGLWNQLSARFSNVATRNEEVWKLNQEFLSQAVKRGDEIILNDLAPVVGSFFEREIKYLLDQGYIQQGYRMIRVP
jgi:hypothetical protein